MIIGRVRECGIYFVLFLVSIFWSFFFVLGFVLVLGVFLEDFRVLVLYLVRENVIGG